MYANVLLLRNGLRRELQEILPIKALISYVIVKIIPLTFKDSFQLYFSKIILSFTVIAKLLLRKLIMLQKQTSKEEWAGGEATQFTFTFSVLVCSVS